ncbi:IS1182 family transposase [Pelomonas sp. Root1444]|uniref:IS1182 family transposase n=1 Tax=Pelomonas sp. Root1444 TaxID=1736464 RepID=UPI000AA327B1|nr:IS1182 family transposase [Pelomonas sp. Root1444]
MPRYKPTDCHSLMLPVVLSEQIVPGSFAFALDYLVEYELDLTALDARFKNDTTGASAFDPRVMLKIVLLAYSQGLISSRGIAAACVRNVQFIAISGDSQPSHAHIAKFVCSLRDQIKPLFSQVLMTCDAQGLIGRDMFAIDGVKLPSNASKERSGTHEELSHRAERLDKAADKILALHQAQDKEGAQAPLDTKRQTRMDELRQEAARTREFVAKTPKRLNSKGQELKSNVTDPDSAKMATSKGVIQGYAAQAAVDSAHQIIIAADVVGSGSEQTMLIPMIEQAKPWCAENTLVTADAGYHSDANVQQLHDTNTPALIADNQMRKRDERFEGQGKHQAKPDPLSQKKASGEPEEIKHFRPKDFSFNEDGTATCPAGQVLSSKGTIYVSASGQPYQTFIAQASDCAACTRRPQCIKGRGAQESAPLRGRQVSRFLPRAPEPSHPSERMRQAIDSPRGRQLYSQRIGTVEPVFANLRHNKRLSRLNHRGQAKVGTQWRLYCLVHNIEKLSKAGFGQHGVR